MKEILKIKKHLDDVKSISSWLDGMDIRNYSINGDLSVDVYGYVNFTYSGLKEIPVQFGKVDGSFYCSNNKLTSLKGCPYSVGGHFVCGNNKLTSLEYIPNNIRGSISINNNKLTSFVLLPFQPKSSYGNPCYKIYKELGWGSKAHVKSLLTLDPNPVDTLEKLKAQLPQRYAILTRSKQLISELGINV